VPNHQARAAAFLAERTSTVNLGTLGPQVGKGTGNAEQKSRAVGRALSGAAHLWVILL